MATPSVNPEGIPGLWTSSQQLVSSRPSCKPIKPHQVARFENLRNLTPPEPIVVNAYSFNKYLGSDFRVHAIISSNNL